MFRFLPYVLNSALRNPVRSVLTILGVGVAISLITGLGAIAESRTRALEAASDTTLIVSELDKFWPTQSLIPGDRGLVSRIEQDVPGVVRATPLIVKQNLWMSSGGGLVKIAGIDKALLRDFVEMEVEEDVWQEFLSRRNAALLGVDLAGNGKMSSRYVWEKGKEFAMADFDGLTLYMAGTFKPKDPTLRSVILVGDVFLQEVDERRGVTNQVLVRLGHRDDGPNAVKAINGLAHAVKLSAESQQVALDQAIADLDELLRLAVAVMVVVGVVILLGLANATSMAVRERTREIGMLRSLGFSRRRIVSLVMGESVLLSLLGGVLGCVLVQAYVTVMSPVVGVAANRFPVHPSAMLFGLALAAAALVGIVGALPAGTRASRRPIVEALGSVD